MSSGSTDEAVTCPVCACDLTADRAVVCTTCGTACHDDCWQFNGRCGIYACGGTNHRPATADDLTGPGDAVITVDEDTHPPLRLAPHIEALVRSLPRWGRAYVPPVGLGMVGAATVFALGTLVFGMPPTGRVPFIVLGCGMASSALAVAVADRLRRHPLAVAASFAVLGFVTCGYGLQSFLGWRDVWFATYIVAGVLAASATAEAILGPLRALQSRGGRLGGVARGLLTMMLTFLGYAAVYWYQSGHLHSSDLQGCLVFSILGLFVACPPLELSTSALMYRLKAEAAREGDEDPTPPTTPTDED